MYLFAGCAETGGIGFHEMLSFRALLEGYHLKVGELEFRLDGNGTRAKTDVPERVAFPQVEHTEREQANGHFGNHAGASGEYVAG